MSLVGAAPTLTTVGRPGRRRSVRSAVPGLLVAAWAALLFNVMAFGELPMVLPIPTRVGQLMTQASLVLAVLLALVANPKVVLRPSLLLTLMTMPAVVALMASLHSEFLFGSGYRAVRLILFLGVLWLLTPWWGRRDMLLLRCHRVTLWIVLGVVYAGAIIAPGVAFSFDGRLAGVLWPVPATQVAHYAAVLLGISIVLWFCRTSSNRATIVAVVVSGAAVYMAHTRTALLAAVVGVAVAGASLFLGHVRVRRVSTLGAVAGVAAATFFASGLTSWVLRGQTPQEAGQLTGRTEVWAAVFDAQRPKIEEIFGSGLSDQSFKGLPVDSNWVATFLDQGWFGVVVDAAVMLLLLLMAASRERGPQRALALFLIVYCLIASITETGLGTASPYTMELAVAASLLVPALPRSGPPRAPLRAVGTAERRDRRPPVAGSSLPTVPAADAAEPRLIDINSADVVELAGLPWPKRRTAHDLVRWRRENGPFRTVDDLLKVRGVGRATLAVVAPLVTVGGDDT